MAEPAALAGLAAQNQGKFWEMHNAIFAMKTKITQEKLDAAAKEIGLDMQQYNNDLNSNETKSRLAKDMSDARNAQVGGTPTLFINGRRIQDRSFQALQKVIDEEAAKSK